MKRWIAPCVCILILLAIPFAVTAALVGDGNATMTPGNVTGNTTGNMTVAGYIAQDQNLTKLAEALNITGFSGMLNSGGPYTVFAPSNDAFNALGNDTVSQLFNDSASLTRVLQYQIVKGEYTSANLTAMAGNQTENQADNASSGGISGIISGLFGGNTAENTTTNTTGTAVTLQTLSDESLNVTVSNGVIMVENATVTMKDINTTNGVIQIVDQVLIPPGLSLTTTGNATGTAENTTGTAGNTTTA